MECVAVLQDQEKNQLDACHHGGNHAVSMDWAMSLLVMVSVALNVVAARARLSWQAGRLAFEALTRRRDALTIITMQTAIRMSATRLPPRQS